jgi:hypothetical protein
MWERSQRVYRLKAVKKSTATIRTAVRTRRILKRWLTVMRKQDSREEDGHPDVVVAMLTARGRRIE